MKLLNNINFYLFKRKGYVIRRSWDDKKLQIGQVYSNLIDAINCCKDCRNYYSVYNAKGDCVFSNTGYIIKSKRTSPEIHDYYKSIVAAILFCPKGYKVFKSSDETLLYDSDIMEDIIVKILEEVNNEKNFDKLIEKSKSIILDEFMDSII